MKVLLESTPFLYGMRAIRRYVVQFATLFPELSPSDEFVFFYRSYRPSDYGDPPEPSAGNASNVKMHVPGKLLRFSWRVFKRPRIDMYSDNVDIVHFPGSFITPTKTRKIVFTLHGLAPLVIPDLIRSSYVNEIKILLDTVVKRGAYFISVSKTTRREFLERFDIPPETIGVTPLGVDRSFRPIDKETTTKKLKQKFNIDYPFVLYVGGIQPNKNINGILKSFAVARDRGLDTHMVLAGERVQEPPEIGKLISELGIQDVVHFLGYVKQDTDDLAMLYNQAEALLFPTFYEGWTSPPLEAMKCRTPVITSNVSSLPETCGDAALFVDPENPEEIAENLLRALEDSELRNKLIEKGVRHASKFTWEKCALKTLEFYKFVHKR